MCPYPINFPRFNKSSKSKIETSFFIYFQFATTFWAFLSGRIGKRIAEIRSIAFWTSSFKFAHVSTFFSPVIIPLFFYLLFYVRDLRPKNYDLVAGSHLCGYLKRTRIFRISENQDRREPIRNKFARISGIYLLFRSFLINFSIRGRYSSKQSFWPCIVINIGALNL